MAVYFFFIPIGLATNFLVKIVVNLKPIKIYNKFKMDKLEITKIIKLNQEFIV
jgi:hypothetical protein